MDNESDWYSKSHFDQVWDLKESYKKRISELLEEVKKLEGVLEQKQKQIHDMCHGGDLRQPSCNFCKDEC